nr:MAG TPA: hypothetical protein [Caudoviricetes sp.]
MLPRQLFQYIVSSLNSSLRKFKLILNYFYSLLF